jgi:hypothetical protein
MELRLYDTLSREKRLFRPLDPARVRMYVCGPTVYDFAHIGNARPVIVFDVSPPCLLSAFPSGGHLSPSSPQRWLHSYRQVDCELRRMPSCGR